MFSRIRSIVAAPSRPGVARYLTGAAWLFIGVSLAQLVVAMVQKAGDPAAPVALYSTIVGGETISAWGLAYPGLLGGVLLVMQAAAVSGGAAMSVMRPGPWRTFGHRVLIGWAAIWMASLLHLAMRNPTFDTIAPSTVMTVLFGCTIARSLLPAVSSRGARPSPIAAAVEETIEDVCHDECDDEMNAPASDATEAGNESDDAARERRLRQWAAAGGRAARATWDRARPGIARGAARAKSLVVGRRLKVHTTS